jgi:hypothetical protein
LDELPVYKGSAKNWEVLDDSFDQQTRKMIQRQIGDYRGVGLQLPQKDGDIHHDHPTAVEERRERVLVNQDEKPNTEGYIPLPTKTQFIE